MSAIRSDGLVKRYGEVRALDGLDLSVSTGALYGFLGPNGAGKTTTMRVLSGLVKPDHGQAFIMGKAVRLHDPEQKVRIGILPEDPSFYGWMTPIAFLRDFVAPLYRLDIATAGKRSAEILEIVGLTGVAERRIAGFSRGMRQRLGLAQAMVHKPDLLLLDEPFSGLDPSGRSDLLKLIASLRGETTILLSTHILADVERICDVIGIIDHGRMLIEAARDKLLASYASPIIEVQFEGDQAEGWIREARHSPYIDHFQQAGAILRLWVNHGADAQIALLSSLAESGLAVMRFEKVTPSLEDVFLRLTQKPDAAVIPGQRS